MWMWIWVWVWVWVCVDGHPDMDVSRETWTWAVAIMILRHKFVAHFRSALSSFHLPSSISHFPFSISKIKSMLFEMNSSSCAAFVNTFTLVGALMSFAHWQFYVLFTLRLAVWSIGFDFRESRNGKLKNGKCPPRNHNPSMEPTAAICCWQQCEQV